MKNPADRTVLQPRRLAPLVAERRVQVIDLRPRVQWQQAHIPGSRNIALDALAAEVITLDRELPIVFYGNDGDAAAEAAEAVRSAGMTAFSLEGGLDDWTASGQSVKTGL